MKRYRVMRLSEDWTGGWHFMQSFFMLRQARAYIEHQRTEYGEDPNNHIIVTEH